MKAGSMRPQTYRYSVGFVHPLRPGERIRRAGKLTPEGGGRIDERQARAMAGDFMRGYLASGLAGEPGFRVMVDRHTYIGRKRVDGSSVALVAWSFDGTAFRLEYDRTHRLASEAIAS